MIGNLSHQQNFSSPNLAQKTSSTKANEAITKPSISFNCSVRKAQRFLFDSDLFLKSDVFFGLSIADELDPELDLFDERQQKNYPTSSQIKLKHRCKSHSSITSKSDKVRIDWKNKGWIEYIRVKGVREYKLRFAENFKKEFILFELEKKRIKLLEQTHLRMITEEDFKLRQEIESRIVSLKIELKKPQSPEVIEA